MRSFGRSIRRRFLLEPGTAHLNHGSFGTVPRAVLAAAARWRRRAESSPDRFMRSVLPPALRGAASGLARFLGADARDLAFVENATSGMNAVLRSLRLQAGDEILATSHVYNAVRMTLRHLCERTGARFVEAGISLPLPEENDLEERIKEKITNRTRLLVLDHIASHTGLIFPVRRLARYARSRGVPVLVDGAHAPGQIPLDIPSLGVDWYTGNCHKWLFAPKGCAFLWARRGAQEDLHPTVISHGYGRGYTAEFDWTGTRDFSSWLAVTDALEFFRRLGPARIRNHNHRLVVQEAGKISEAWKSPVDGPPELHGAMTSIRLPAALQRADPLALQNALMLRHRVIVPVARIDGTLWVRISAQVYNAPSDYDRLLQAVKRIKA